MQAQAQAVAVVAKIVSLAAQGFRIFITPQLYAKVRDVLKELGFEVKVVKTPPADGNYILMKLSGIRVDIEVYVDGVLSKRYSVSLNKFVDALRALAGGKGAEEKGEAELYEIIVPPEIIAAAAELIEGEKAGGLVDEAGGRRAGAGKGVA